MSVMKCESSAITMTLYWHNSQVFSLGNYVDDTPIETSLTAGQLRPRPSFPCLMLSDPSLAGVEASFPCLMLSDPSLAGVEGVFLFN